MNNHDFSNSDVPPLVFKYRDWANPIHRTIIEQGQLFYTDPREFEDSEDCNLPIRYDLLSEEEMIVSAVTIARDMFPNWNETALNYEAKRLAVQMKTRPASWHEEMARNTYNSMCDHIGVISFSAVPDNEFLWHHYANGDTGFSIGYDSCQLFNHLGGGTPVSYYEQLPKVLPRPFMSHEEQWVIQISSKRIQFASEKEYRCFTFSDSPLFIDQRKVTIPSSAIGCIILGRDCSASNGREIRAAASASIGDIIEETIDPNGRMVLKF